MPIRLVLTFALVLASFPGQALANAVKGVAPKGAAGLRLNPAGLNPSAMGGEAIRLSIPSLSVGLSLPALSPAESLSAPAPAALAANPVLAASPVAPLPTVWASPREAKTAAMRKAAAPTVKAIAARLEAVGDGGIAGMGATDAHGLSENLNHILTGEISAGIEEGIAPLPGAHPFFADMRSPRRPSLGFNAADARRGKAPAERNGVPAKPVVIQNAASGAGFSPAAAFRFLWERVKNRLPFLEAWARYRARRKNDAATLDRAAFGTRISAMSGGKIIEGVLVDVNSGHAVLASEKDGVWSTRNYRRRALSYIEETAVAEEVDIPKAAALKARMDRRAHYFRFLENDIWGTIAPRVKEEILALRKTEDRKAHLRALGAEITARIQAQRGAREIGYHYNLHGGSAEAYVTGGGIRAGRGDIALQYGGGDLAYKVYLFRSSGVNLYDVLNESNPNLISPRMGNVLNIFEADSDFMRQAFAAGHALKPTAISIDFEDNWINGRGMLAVPYSTYLAPPLEPFLGRAGRRLGPGVGRLSKDEETLAAMRYIEAVVLGAI